MSLSPYTLNFISKWYQKVHSEHPKPQYLEAPCRTSIQVPEAEAAGENTISMGLARVQISTTFWR
jgi:hypothetical protein